MSDAFWEGLWSGLFELIALGLVAGWVNLLYQRQRERSSAQRQLGTEIDLFLTQLYKPRKVYQLHLAREAGEAGREEALYRCLEELIDAAGRFRALQVQLLHLFAYHQEIFAHYLAIWNYLRELRRRMERQEGLYFHHEDSASSDAFYQLLDRFRYLTQTTPMVAEAPQLTTLPVERLRAMEQRAATIYQERFGVQIPPAHRTQEGAEMGGEGPA